MKLSFEISDQFLSPSEQEVFNNFLSQQGLDVSIWKVFQSLFDAPAKKTKPFLLKIFDKDELVGVVILIRCRKYGRTLFSNTFLTGIMNTIDIPFYLWIKFGCCMDMMSNEGFVKNIKDRNVIIKAAIKYLRKNSFLTIVNDYTQNNPLYPEVATLPALPHALIACGSFQTINDYLSNFKNIKKKLRVFKNKGGEFHLIQRKMDEQYLPNFKKCFQATSENSVFYLPYQTLYFSSASHTNQTEIENAYYFIATINGEFIGYQAAIKTGKHLNALHGAFDRTMRSTFHAYDILFVKMVELAIEHQLEYIDFGAVINETKSKMVNEKKEMSYFILSKYKVVEWTFKSFLKLTNIQSKKQLIYR